MKRNLDKPPKVIAFDCDGVLFDSKKANILFYNYILDHFSLPSVKPEQENYIHMYSVEESLKFLIEDQSKARDALNFAKQVDFRMFNNHLHPEEGLVECLSQLKAYYRLALATNRTASTHEVLSHFGLKKFFDLIVCALDVPRPKPHRDMMDKIISSFGVENKEIVYIGDSVVDALFSKASGTFFIAYKNPSLEANLHVNSFRELLERFSLKK